MPKRAPVDVFAYRDHRAFLAAFHTRASAQNGGFSYADFSKRVGLRSPNYLKLVIDGERNLSVDMAHRFGEACGLSGQSLRFFCSLVAFGQAKTTRERDRHYAELQTFRRFRASHRLDAAQSAYHSQWYIPAIHELCAREDFQDDPRWIGSTLLPSISAKDAAQALKVLQQLGLIGRDEQGRLRQTEPVVETHEGPLGHQVVQFHREMLRCASEAIDRVPREEREIAALTLCVSEERMEELRAEVEAFRRDLFRRYQTDPRPERVVQANFQVFPLSKKGSDQ